ncbi:MAG: hypothetical protein LBB82_09170 [Treponema sp.]|jgi:hypothetical protein|nr:hypothetical protein [Treponema sp.]
MNEELLRAAALFAPFAKENFLLTLVSRGIYNRAQKDYAALGEKPRLSAEQDRLIVTLPGAEVHLEKDFAKSHCSCPAQTNCKHLLMALFAAAELVPAGAAEEAAETESAADDGSEADQGKTESALPDAPALALVEHAKVYAASFLEKGFITADQTDAARCVQFSLQFEGEGIGGLSRLFRGIADDIENMLGKNSAFHPGLAFASVSRVYNTTSLILAHRDDAEKCSALIEKSRSVYRLIKRGEFTGLGAYPWQTRSGYAGVTALVFHQESGRIASYTLSMADYYEKTKNLTGIKNLRSLLYRQDNWDAGVSLKQIGGENFGLWNFRLNDEGRISSAGTTHYIQRKKTAMSDIAKIAVTLAGEKKKKDSDGAEKGEGYFKKRRSAAYRIIFAAGIHDCVFDKLSQALTFTVELVRGGADGTGDETDSESCVEAFIPYSEINADAIRFIEEQSGLNAPGHGAQNAFPRYFICSSSQRGLVPLSAIGEDGVENWYFGGKGL